MNRTELTKAIVWLDMLASEAKAESAKLRDQLAQDARAEMEEQGTAPTWRIPDVATISASVRSAGAYVEDEAALLKWVEARYPTEVERIVRIRDPWLRTLLSRVDDTFADPDTGEPVPGLSWREGGTFMGVSVRVSAAAKEVFSALARHGLERLAIEAGPAVPVELVSAHLDREVT